MNLLIIGGTRFVGRHLVEQALQAGHGVELFHRGQSGAHLFPHLRHRLGDRDRDLSALADGHWDAVIDTCAYAPRQVRATAELLRDRVGLYLLVSTVSVYREGSRDYDETAPRQTLPDPAVEVVDATTYGALKALCEDALQHLLPARACIVRPGLIVGPHDPTERFTWWVRRMLRGGEVLAPGDPAGPVQWIDVRDLACFMLRLVAQGACGALHATGPTDSPEAPLTMSRLLDTALRVLNPSATLTWVDEAFLLREGVKPWQDLPLWLDRESAGLATARLERAKAAGLSCRPIAQTLQDTARWAAAKDAEIAPTGAVQCGLTPLREAALLEAWQAVRG